MVQIYSNRRESEGNSYSGVFSKLTKAIVLFLRPVDGPIGLQLQVEALSTVELCDYPLQLGLWREGWRKKEGERERETGLNPSPITVFLLPAHHSCSSPIAHQKAGRSTAHTAEL